MEKRGKKKGSPKTGGRKKGTPNKRTLAFRDILIERNFCIPSEAVKLWDHPEATLEIKLRILEFLATYAHSKLLPKTVEDEQEDFSDIDPLEAEAALAQH